MNIPVSANLGRVPKMPNGMHALAGDINVYIKNGRKHRENGPAEIHKRSGIQKWFKNGLLHRKQGPAVTDPVSGMQEYWIDGKLIKKEKIKL